MSDKSLRKALSDANLEWSKERVPQKFTYHPWAYKLLSKAVITRIVEKKPRTILELIDIRGIGQKLSAQYGERILELVREHGPKVHVGVDLGGDGDWTGTVTVEVDQDGTQRVTKIDEFP